MRKLFALSLAVVLCCTTLLAKGTQSTESYNYQRGVELIQDAEYDDGIQFLEKELSNNPKNGYAMSWLAVAYAHDEEWGTSIHYLTQAQKYLPKSEKHYLAWSHSLRAKIYLNMEDTANAITSLDMAVKTEPKNEDWYESRGELYRELKRWRLSDADFQKYIDLTPGQIRGHLQLAYNLYLQERYQEALNTYQYAHKLAERSFTYSGMAECEIKLGLYEEAADHIIQSLELEDYESTALDLIGSCRQPEFVELMNAKLRVQILKNPNSVNWHIYQLHFYRFHRRFEDAIRVGKEVRKITPEAYMDDIISNLYFSLGDMPHALEYINMAIEGDSTDNSYLNDRANIYTELDSFDLAIQDQNTLIQREPEDEVNYSQRAMMYFLHGDYTKAIDDYDLALALESNYQWARYMRARVMLCMGDTAKAMKDIQRVFDQSKNESNRVFAAASLGNSDFVIHYLDSVLQTADSCDYFYNAACQYALIGEQELAMQTLIKALNDGFAEFVHLRNDPDFVSLHGEAFDSLVSLYQQRASERVARFLEEEGEQAGEERVVEIPFTAANGVTKVECTINGLPLSFIFDTGASDVTLSLTEANFMFKNGYLSTKDIVGKQSYQTADGSVSVGTVFILNHINFGGLELTGVQASVVQNQKAPLLLGQTVLKRLGKIEIDNERRILRITTK